MPAKGQRESMADRLERNSIPEPNSGCLLWLGSVSETSGHGRMKVEGKWLSPHRVAYAEKHGPIPDGIDVLHKCDVSCCIEDKHLFPGTHGDNMADMARKGRVRGFTPGHTTQPHPSQRRPRGPNRAQKTAPSIDCNPKE